eukprot:gene8174-9707_t
MYFDVVWHWSAVCRICASGEVYDNTTQSCIPCEAGFIKFDNSSSECADCRDYSYAVKCLGGSTFEVLQGAWLAPNAVHCDDTTCFFDRLYECLSSNACTNDESSLRVANSLAGVSDLELCSPEKYRVGVMCGGGDPVVCAKNHIWYIDATTCHECPELWLSMVFLLCLIITALFLLYIIFRLFTALKRQCEQNEEQLEMASQDRGSFQVTNTIFTGNAAYSGAGIMIGTLPIFLDISNVTFLHGISTIGGGISMSVPLYRDPFLQDIVFKNNTAKTGHNVFWLHPIPDSPSGAPILNFTPPVCTNCSTDSMPLMATSEVRSTVYRDGVDIGGTNTNIKSAETITPPM